MTISASIPGIDYQLRGDMFVAKDGTTLTGSQFLEKVANKEITLTGDSLKFLDSKLGPDLMGSLRLTVGFLTPPGQLDGKLGSTDEAMGDLFMLMQLLEKLTQVQKKNMQEVKRGESEMNITLLERSAKQELDAALTKAIAGAVSGIFTVISGAMGAKGGLTGTDAGMSTWGGYGKFTEGLGGLVTAGINFAGSSQENQAKMTDIQAKKVDEMSNESKDKLDAIRELMSKVKETLQAIEQARQQTTQRINQM